MSFAVPATTSLLIIMRKADLEYRLMSITQTLQQLNRASSQATEDLINKHQYAAMYATPGCDDEADVALEVMNSNAFMFEYNKMMREYKAKEDKLESEKIQIQNQLTAYKTMEDGVNEMIKSGAKDFKVFSGG